MKFKKIFRKLKDKIAYKFFLTYFLAATVLLSVIIIYFYNRMYASIITDYLNYKQTEINQLSKGIDANIDSKSFQSTALIYNLDLLRPYLNYREEYADYTHLELERQVNNLLNNLIITNYNNFDGIAIFSMNGDLLARASANDYTIKEENIQSEIWFESVIDADGSAVLSVSNQFLVPTPANSNDIIVIARTINDYNNGHMPMGISIFYQRISKFTEDVFTVSGRNISEETFFMITPENSIVYADPYDEALMDQLVHQNIAKLTSGDIYTFDGASYYLIYSTSPIHNFFSGFLISKEVILQKTQPLTEMFLVIVTVMLIAGIIISYVISHIISAPIKQTLFAAGQVEQGNLDIHLNVRGNDEIAQIGKNILLLIHRMEVLMKNQYEQELYLKEIEFEALQSKINPHFLYNTLSMISLLVNKEDFNTANQMLLNLSDIFRYCLNRGKNTVPLFEEIAHTQKYLEIQQMRFNNKFHVYYDIDKCLEECALPRLTLQPIIENSIIHGFEALDGLGEIRIFTQTALDTLYIYIQDNGVGMDYKKLADLNELLSNPPGTISINKSNKSIGLNNVNARIKLLFGRQYGIRILANPSQGVTVRLSIPLPKMMEVTYENSNR